MTTPLESLVADFKFSVSRLGKTPPDSVRRLVDELKNNVYPSLIALAEQLIEVDGVIQEVVEPTESYLTRDLADLIAMTIACGGMLCSMVEGMLESMDDMTKQRAKKLVEDFTRSANQASIGVALAAGDDEDDDEDSDEDSEGDEGDEGDEGEGDEGDEGDPAVLVITIGEPGDVVDLEAGSGEP